MTLRLLFVVRCVCVEEIGISLPDELIGLSGG